MLTSDRAHRLVQPVTPRTIPASTIAALSELLVRMMRDESSENADATVNAGAEVRGALRALCDDARAHRVRVEQLLIAIKQGWASLHNDHPRARSAGPDAMLNQMITLCIDEYYSHEQRA